MATFDEASACPKCGLTGKVGVERKLPDRSKLLTIYCENPVCRWYGTPWNVSVREDGSIPDPTEHKGDKTYIGMEHDNEEAQRVINYLTELELESRKPKQ